MIIQFKEIGLFSRFIPHRWQSVYLLLHLLVAIYFLLDNKFGPPNYFAWASENIQVLTGEMAPKNMLMNFSLSIKLETVCNLINFLQLQNIAF